MSRIESLPPSIPSVDLIPRHIGKWEENILTPRRGMFDKCTCKLFLQKSTFFRVWGVFKMKFIILTDMKIELKDTI